MQRVMSGTARPVRHVDTAERRARLAARHAVHPDHRAATIEEAADAMVCLHGTDPAGVYLAALARVDRLTAAGVDRALHVDRTLVKHVAMRRTLFVFSRDRLPVAHAAAGPRVEHGERRALVRDVERTGLHADGARWLDDACAAVVQLLADGRARSLDELRDEIPALRGATEQGAGRSWGGLLAVGPRVLTVLSAQGRVVRAGNDGHWRTSRHRWSSMGAWLGHDLDPVPVEQAEVTLVAWWLRTFGPGTEADLRWWLGSTLSVVRRALNELGAVPVDLGGQTGYLLSDDTHPAPPVDPWAALLPVMDPTVMGWKERGWYVGDHRDRIFDSAGNAGPTAWWGGRVVGTWRQDDDGVVVTELFEDVGAEARRRLDAEAERVTAFCDGVRVIPRWR